MRACVQRVSDAKVVVDGEVVGEIGRGLVVLLGVAQGDTTADAEWMADKTLSLRIFEDDEGKMNRSVIDAQGGVLGVSQFTLLGDCRKGRRPSFIAAADPIEANDLYEHYVRRLQAGGVPVATGRFQTHMDVTLTNDGPVTILLDSKKLF